MGTSCNNEDGTVHERFRRYLDPGLMWWKVWFWPHFLSLLPHSPFFPCVVMSCFCCIYSWLLLCVFISKYLYRVLHSIIMTSPAHLYIATTCHTSCYCTDESVQIKTFTLINVNVLWQNSSKEFYYVLMTPYDKLWFFSCLVV